MKITFTSSFFKSLKKIHMYNTWWYKTFDFIRYDFWRFFYNIWKFRKELLEFQPWDYSLNLRIFKQSLELTRSYLKEHGYEVEHSRDKKIVMMSRVIELLNNFIDQNFLDQAENQLNVKIFFGKGWLTEEQKENNNKIYDLSTKLEDDQWKELWEIIHGNYHDKIPKNADYFNGDYDKIFNGTDMRGWWD